MPAQWQPYLSLGTGLLAIPALLRHPSRPLPALALLLTLVALYRLSPWLLTEGDDAGVPPAHAAREAIPLKVIGANLMASAEPSDALVEWVRGEDPDLVVLQEFRPDLPGELPRLLPRLPHAHLLPEGQDWKLCVLSRHPLKRRRRITPPRLLGHYEIALPRGRFELLATHLMPPLSTSKIEDNEVGFREIERLARERRHPLLVVGDLNQAPWSARMRDLVRRARLVDPRRRYGWLPTWSPSFLPVPLLPIDHLLASREFTVRRMERGPRGNSDHHALVWEVELR